MGDGSLMRARVALLRASAGRLAKGFALSRHVLSMVDDRPYKAGVAGSSPAVPTIYECAFEGARRTRAFGTEELFAEP